MRDLGRSSRFWLMFVALSGAASLPCRGQAALLLEQPYALSRVTNPTGHAAIYLSRVCAATPTRLRRCAPGELGAVIARYNGISGYDWVAIPLLPYLYAVDDPTQVPGRADRATVERLRRQYREEHLLVLGSKLGEGGLIRRGWNQLAGVSYNRRVYALRFRTTPEQDDRFLAWMNSRPNRTHFHILWSNCSNFASGILGFYLPGVFRRRPVPDAGIATPRQVAYQLERYTHKHPELELATFEVPQIAGNHLPSTPNRSVAGALLVTGYIAPVAVFAPYVAAGIGANFLIWGRYPLDLKEPRMLGPKNLGELDQTLTSTASR